MRAGQKNVKLSRKEATNIIVGTESSLVLTVGVVNGRSDVKL